MNAARGASSKQEDSMRLASRARKAFLRQNPSTRLVASLIIVPALATIPASHWEATLFFSPPVLALVLVSGVSAAKLSRSTLALLPIFFLVALKVFYQGQGESEVLLSEPLLVRFYPSAVSEALTLLFRSLLALTSAVALFNGVAFSGLIEALESMKVPGLLLDSLTVMRNFSFSFSRELERFSLARRARNFSASYLRDLSLRATNLGVLFLRCHALSERIHRAMLMRGWGEGGIGAKRKLSLDYGFLGLVTAFSLLSRLLASLL